MISSRSSGDKFIVGREDTRLLKTRLPSFQQLLSMDWNDLFLARSIGSVTDIRTCEIYFTQAHQYIPCLPFRNLEHFLVVWVKIVHEFFVVDSICFSVKVITNHQKFMVIFTNSWSPISPKRTYVSSGKFPIPLKRFIS